MKPTFGSLFAGVGGFDLGFEQAGWECRFQVEWDKNCQQTLAYHWPDVQRWGDVCDVNGAELPPVDCITFGSPCQDLSLAGKRKGLEGDRSSMFYEAIRIIKEMRDATGNTFPHLAIWENVPGAFSSNDGRDFGSVLDALAVIGALGIEWAVLDAASWVPQRRKRVFVIADFNSSTANRGGRPILAFSESSSRGASTGKQEGQGVAGEVANCLRSGGAGGVPTSRGENLVPFSSSSFGGYEEGVGTLRVGSNRSTLLTTDAGDREIVGALMARDSKGVGNQYVEEGKLIVQDPLAFSHTQGIDCQPSTEVTPTLRAVGNGAAIMFDGRRVDDVRVWEDESPTLTRQMGTGGNNVPMLMQDSPTYFTKRRRAQNSDDFETWIEGSVSPTLNAFDNTGDSRATVLVATPDEKPQFSDQSLVRRLTPIECERLMGWPDDHTLFRADGKQNADSTRYRMCGNGVASPVARWLASQIRAELGL